MTVLTVTAGTMFLMWIGEQITERGIGNGISLIIMAGIVARLPSALGTTVQFVREGEMSIFLLIFILAIAAAVIAGIVYIETGAAPDSDPVCAPRGRPPGVRRAELASAAEDQHLRRYPADFRVVVAGLSRDAGDLRPVPEAVLELPDARAAWYYDIVYVALIVFFCYFYTAVTFNPVDVADNLKKYGGFIPGIRPGRFTADYIDRVLSRITLGGAIYVSAVCVLPTILIARFNVPFFFGGTALLIVVGVALDTVAQIETHLLTRNYEGFMRRGRVKTKRGA